MKTMYEVNWHYENDTLVRISVSPIKVLRDIVQGHLDDGDELDSFTLQLANTALEKLK